MSVKLEAMLRGVVQALNEANDAAREASLANLCSGAEVEAVAASNRAAIDEPSYVRFSTYSNRDGVLKKQFHGLPKALFMNHGVLGVREATVRMSVALHASQSAELWVAPALTVDGSGVSTALTNLEFTLSLGELPASGGALAINRLAEFSVVSHEVEHDSACFDTKKTNKE